jgi:hypothetical protein
MTTENDNGQPWYTATDPQTLPLALSVQDASALCGLDERTGFHMALHGEWKPLVKRYGERGLLIRTKGLLAWLETEQPTMDERSK